jgi:hypothetical protein
LTATKAAAGIREPGFRGARTGGASEGEGDDLVGQLAAERELEASAGGGARAGGRRSEAKLAATTTWKRMQALVVVGLWAWCCVRGRMSVALNPTVASH